MIEKLREQKEREDRVLLEELEKMRKENKDLKDKLSALQPQKPCQSQLASPGPTQNQRPDKEVGMMFWYLKRCCAVNVSKLLCYYYTYFVSFILDYPKDITSHA